MKKKEEIPPQAWIRLAVLIAVVGGIVWFALKNNVELEGEIAGKKVLPEKVQEGLDILGEQIEKIVPSPARARVEKTVKEKIVLPGQKVIEEKITREVKENVERFTGEITNFPEKQKKELEKQIIQQVCNDLLKKVEEEDEGD
ncbi:hypothetical protein J7J95_01295 [bacterium]|nr:hypothetical protein [bacterium]